ncbi:MAG TPA: hypothetical protein VM032_17520 [Vicinamibacterales bacterium]|nr:hypothetical protein [Vicinamibacterales bacterium]
MRRRDLLRSTAIGGLVAAVGAPASVSAAGQGPSPTPERALDRVADAIAALRGELREQHEFTELASVRAAQKLHLRANGKLPDFIEVGADVWFQVHDWHVRWQRPIAESRDAQGRPTLALNQTVIILRPDVPANYMGLPFDAR